MMHYSNLSLLFLVMVFLSNMALFGYGSFGQGSAVLNSASSSNAFPDVLGNMLPESNMAYEKVSVSELISKLLVLFDINLRLV